MGLKVCGASHESIARDGIAHQQTSRSMEARSSDKSALETDHWVLLVIVMLQVLGLLWESGMLAEASALFSGLMQLVFGVEGLASWDIDAQLLLQLSALVLMRRFPCREVVVGIKMSNC